MNRQLASLALLLASSAALASPDHLSYQGRLLEADGEPSEGPISLVISLYTSPTGGTPVWSETDDVNVARGYFSTSLGDQVPLTGLDLGSTAYWIGVGPSLESEMEPRTPLQAVPVALAVAGGGAAGSGPLVFGRESIGHSPGWISFPRPMEADPIIVGTIGELSDSGAVTHRVIQSSRHGFGVGTWNCSATDIGDSYAFVAAEPGTHTIDGATIEAGRVGPTSGFAFSITFARPFSQPPVVLLTVDEREDNSGATACRVESLSNTMASGRCWNNTESDDTEGLYYIALEPTPAAGLAYNGRRIHAGRHMGATGSPFTIPAPSGLVAAPGVMVMSIENNGVSGGPTSVRSHRASNGTTIAAEAWHCPSDVRRTPFAVHWLFID